MLFKILTLNTELFDNIFLLIYLKYGESSPSGPKYFLQNKLYFCDSYQDFICFTKIQIIK